MGDSGGNEKSPTGITSANIDPTIVNDGSKKGTLAENELPTRAAWSSQWEFLMSCIATSVGLGNVWRFPFTAYRNGGGAFLIPYIIVLIIIGKPMYYLECVLGQFSSRNSIKIWSMAPAMRGAGFASLLACCYVLSYYVFIVALCMYFLAMSFQSVVPWAVCDPEWRNCAASDPTQQVGPVPPNASSSAELYFIKTVLQKSEGIDDGLGGPIWYLVVCLLASWIIVFIIIAQGIKSSGKAAYFLAIFPYIVMLILLITTATLPGAGQGILFFLTPQWDKLLEISVWYAAVTQVFYSLSVASGALVMFSSYNAFRGDSGGNEKSPTGITSANIDPTIVNDGSKKGTLAENELPTRAAWSSQWEFLMSCIATSVGLGNVWRFPFTAYRNGGGAFLIPYIIVLIIIGKPMYYLECVLGQFSSRNSIKIWSMAPAMRGAGFASLLACCYVLSYYVFIVALCMYFLAMSFQSVVPWAVCDPEWRNCAASDPTQQVGPVPPNASSSAELYFIKTVLQKSEGIDDGLGGPIWYLVVCLLASWIIVFIIIAQGIKSSGKAAYFLAIFPYIVMLILLITTATLPGAGQGILFFLTPQWDKLLEISVWYAAVTQVFYSLSVASGALVMFSSYNAFRVNVYRDAMIVTTLDTLTSLISGLTVFGILGNLANELDQDVSQVVGNGGSGLAFISYPDAIARTFLPQLFSVLFFSMMGVLGIGSGVAILSTINTVLLDAFPRVKTIYMSAVCSSAAFLLGIVYCTPGGQFVMELVDYYGGSALILFCATTEVIGVLWIYGLENLCEDIEFMLGIKTAIFWRFCWGIVCPIMMGTIFIVSLVSLENYEPDGYVYPVAAYVCGYLMLFLGISFVPISICMALFKYRTGNFFKTVKKSFSPKPSWGPRAPAEKKDWLLFKREAQMDREKKDSNWFTHIVRSLIGSYRRKRN